MTVAGPASDRDIDREILGHLLRIPADQNHISQMARNLGLSRTAVRNHLRVMQRDGWVRCYPSVLVEGGANIWELTEDGQRAAYFRKA